MLQFLPLIGSIIDKAIPDPAAQAQAKIEMMKLEQEGAFKDLEAQLQRDLQQIELNKIEAQSPSLFKSGWRPMIGWVCGFGLIYATILFPLLQWVAVIWNITPPPNLETGVLLTALGGILGIGGMRSYEKKMGLTK